MTADKFTVETSLIRLFAQSLGDTNPVYYEETAAGTELGGVIAPPTFIQASAHWDPDYPLRWQRDKPWNGSGPGDGDRYGERQGLARSPDGRRLSYLATLGAAAGGAAAFVEDAATGGAAAPGAASATTVFFGALAAASGEVGDEVPKFVPFPL